jgi:hypothetical protein
MKSQWFLIGMLIFYSAVLFAVMVTAVHDLRKRQELHRLLKESRRTPPVYKDRNETVI